MNTQYNSSYIFSITLVATLEYTFGYDTAAQVSGTAGVPNTVHLPPHNTLRIRRQLRCWAFASPVLITVHHWRCTGRLLQLTGFGRDSLKIAALLFFISGIGSASPELGFTTINPDNAVPVYLAGYVSRIVIYRIIGVLGRFSLSMLTQCAYC